MTALYEVVPSFYNITLYFGSVEEHLSLVKIQDSHSYSLVVYVFNSSWERTLVDINALPTALDVALINVVNTIDDDKYQIFGIGENCHRCVPQLLWSQEGLPYFQVNTNFKMNFDFRTNIDGVQTSLVTRSILFGDHGAYTMVLKLVKGEFQIDVITDQDPDPYWIPLIVGASIILFLILTWLLALYIWKNKCQTDSHEDIQSVVKKRVKSLDTFRGLAVTVMIFVNYGGGGYWFFEHAYWNGLTVADLVFPWFIWIMGSAMPFSLKNIHAQKKKLDPLYKIVRRSVILFAIGLFLWNGYDIQNWRIPGVLQRFSISYLVVGLMFFIPPLYPFSSPYKRINNQEEHQSEEHSAPPIPRWSSYFQDLLPYLFHWLIISVFLTIYLLVQYLVDVPGCGKGYLGPGGIGDDGKYENCTGGAHFYIDKLIFGINHIYQHPTCEKLYKTGAFDPEGFLGFFTSICLCYFGVQAGRIISTYSNSPRSILIRWITWGIVLGAIGTALCAGSENNGIMPINKNLWSVSFICVMGGTAFLVLSLFYILIDVLDIWNGAPFIYVGMNPIIIYCGHDILGGYFPFSFKSPDTHTFMLLQDCIGVGVWLIIAFRMAQLKFFVSI
eukprot:TRINITY_DN4133_c0_g1_i2.p1 TRINITY_DN4133_c0_g1~~TRINITY_DN4133_c0_g1_i2.p1  ORF type:complete len:669 (-),score=69.59 TRINITY_DN4133_c0_g1_i2:44-1879(-)